MRALPVWLVVSVLCTLSAPLASQAPTSPPPSAAVPATGSQGSIATARRGVHGRLRRARPLSRGKYGIATAGATGNRVVFFGDSITDLWRLHQSFPGRPYVNRGIGGQTTSQMLVRFRQDVIELRPVIEFAHITGWRIMSELLHPERCGAPPHTSAVTELRSSKMNDVVPDLD